MGPAWVPGTADARQLAGQQPPRQAPPSRAAATHLPEQARPPSGKDALEGALNTGLSPAAAGPRLSQLHSASPRPAAMPHPAPAAETTGTRSAPRRGGSRDSWCISPPRARAGAHGTCSTPRPSQPERRSAVAADPSGPASGFVALRWFTGCVQRRHLCGLRGVRGPF